MGNRKKFEYVCASKTSLAETEITKPKSVEIIDRRKILTTNKNQFSTGALKYKTEINIGVILFKTPKKIALVIFAMIISSILIGASNNLSNARDFLSNVIVTASIEVVPKRILIATIPGKTSSILKPFPVLINSISIHAKGKIIPQLMFGGFK